MFEYLAISKYIQISKLQFSSTLASFFLLADHLSIKLTNETSFNLFYTAQITAQIIEFLPSANIFTNKF